MKKLALFLILILMTAFNVTAKENYMNAMWVSTVYGLDFPKTVGEQSQKNEIINILETAKNCGITDIYFQVRAAADSFYNSSLVPKSVYLNGTTDYDPLEYIIQQAHARGLKLHAWFNPYRVSLSVDNFEPEEASVYYTHPEWIKISANKYVLDPGIPEARRWIEECVSEVLENYDVDGIHFDDYFYQETADSSLEDEETYAKYGIGFSDKGDWRRNNTYLLIKETYEMIKSKKPEVEFGVSPAGIWRNKKDDAAGSETSGAACYDKYYADTKKWVEDEIIDYIVPQVYWSNDVKAAPYDVVVRWWNDVAEGTRVKLYIGHAAYKINDGGSDSSLGTNGVGEINRQYLFNKELKNVSGSAFFRAANVAEWQSELKEIISGYKEITAEEKSAVVVYDKNGRLENCFIRTPQDGKIKLEMSVIKDGFCKAYSIAGE